MARIADYMVVWRAAYLDEEGPDALVADVKRMIDDGWEPIGGIAIYGEPRFDNDSSRIVFAQALVRGYA